MSEYQIVHLLSESPYRGRKIGFGVRFGEEIFNVDLKTIIDKLKSGTKFYVEAAGYKAYTEVATHNVTGWKYIRTIPDNTKADNLSTLETHTCSGDGPGSWGWENPTQATELPFTEAWRFLARTKNTTFPHVLDSHGWAPDCDGRMAAGYNNYYESHTIGSLSGNILYRGLIGIDISALDARKVVKAEIYLKKLQTFNSFGQNVSNIGSALSSVWRLYGPWTDFIDPTLMSTQIINNIPTWGGQGVLSYYDDVNQTVRLDVTQTIDLWKRGIVPNHGLMLLGPTEAKPGSPNNDSFYSCYEVTSISAEQPIEIPW